MKDYIPGLTLEQQFKLQVLSQEIDVPPTAAALTESCKNAIGRRFVESLIAKNPGWGYEMVDGVVTKIWMMMTFGKTF